MAFLIDTSVAIQVEREGGQLQGVLERVGDDDVAMAAITASELLHGVHRAETAVRRERRLHQVQAILEAVSILPFDLNVAEVHARIWADLAVRGQLIGAHDLIIAATAVTYELPVATLNQNHFRRIDGLNLLP